MPSIVIHPNPPFYKRPYTTEVSVYSNRQCKDGEERTRKRKYDDISLSASEKAKKSNPSCQSASDEGVCLKDKMCDITLTHAKDRLLHATEVSIMDWRKAHGPPVDRLVPPGATREIFTLRPFAKKFIRDLISFVVEIHDDGYCLDRTAFNKIMILRGRIVLKHIDVKAKTAKAIADDYCEVYDLIMNIIFENDDTYLPMDIMRLLSLLKKLPNDLKDEVEGLLLRDHLSLMNDKSQHNFILQFTDIYPQFNRTEKGKFLTACRRMLPFHNTWKQLVQLNSVLLAVYNEGLRRNSHSKTYPNSETYFDRNFLSHFLTESQPDRRDGPLFRYEDGVHILRSQFEESIAVLPEILYRSGLLASFSLKDSF